MGDNKEGEYNRRILPYSNGETTNEIKLHTKPNDNSYRHGNIEPYLHRFTIREAPDCPCGNGNQTV